MTKSLEVRWSGEAVARSINHSNERYFPFIEFAASAESSTQHAFFRFSVTLDAAISEAKQNSSLALAEKLESLSQWLKQWVLEEANHVQFFSALHDSMQCARSQTVKKGIQSFHIEQPIPLEQSWSTTLLFLLYSEIASMIWYRVWYNDASDFALRSALRHLHRDEVEHFRKFSAFCFEISQLQNGFSDNARRVLSFFAMAFRKIRQNREIIFPIQRELKGDINWWEHQIFRTIDYADSILTRIFAMQKKTCLEIEAASLRSTL